MKEKLPATCECDKCGMAVNKTCAKCDASFVDASLKIGDGNSVQIVNCPSGEGVTSNPYAVAANI